MRIAAYCRVSTGSDKQLYSLENQKEFFTEYASKNGHILVRIYADEGISGTSLKKRTEFMRLMADARLGLFDMVVCKDVSRFARNTVDLLNSIRELKSMGISLNFLNANMESHGESELLLTIMGAVAQEESVNLSKRIKFGKKVTGKKGRVPRVIYGYDHVDNYTLSINPDEAETVRLIFCLYTEEGYGCRKISRELNSRGITTKNGCTWDSKGVRRILTNSIYCGEYINCKFEVRDCLTKKLVSTPAEAHIHHQRPEWAIVSSEIFERAQNLLGKRRKQYDSLPFREMRNSTKHLFSTLIKCENCGRTFARKHYFRVNGSERVFWKCSANDCGTADPCENTFKIDEGELFDAIREYFSSIINNKEEFIKELVDDILNEGGENKQGTAYFEAGQKKERLEVKRKRYQEMYANDVMTLTELKDKLDALDREILLLDKSLENGLKIEKTDREAVEERRNVEAEIERFLCLKGVTNVDLKQIIEQITVNDKGGVKIYIKESKCPK